MPGGVGREPIYWLYDDGMKGTRAQASAWKAGPFVAMKCGINSANGSIVN